LNNTSPAAPPPLVNSRLPEAKYAPMQSPITASTDNPLKVCFDPAVTDPINSESLDVKVVPLPENVAIVIDVMLLAAHISATVNVPEALAGPFLSMYVYVAPVYEFLSIAPDPIVIAVISSP
jgi:hypothetical protein